MVCYDTEHAESEFQVAKSPRIRTRDTFARPQAPNAKRRTTQKPVASHGGIRLRRNRRWSW